MHQCDRKQINGALARKFTLNDLIAMHRREFNIIAHNATREQRFTNLQENLFPTYLYETQSTQWRTYLTDRKQTVNRFEFIAGVSKEDADIHHLSTLLALNQPSSSVTAREGSMRRQSLRQRKSMGSQQTSSTLSPSVREHSDRGRRERNSLGGSSPLTPN